MTNRSFSSRSELETLSKDELIEMLLKTNGGSKVDAEAAPVAAGAPPSKKQRRQERTFDMSRHAQRHVALRVAYIGTEYQGFAYVQDAPTATVEGQLLLAATKTCLITDRDSCGFVCGGRTDKGVSGLGQVVSLRLRSNLTSGEGVVGYVPASDTAAAAKVAAKAAATAGKDGGSGGSGGSGSKPELDYCKILNAVLPEDIRVTAWHPVDADFSARFSAGSRTYKYFFPRGRLDIDAMRAAASRLVGEHDLRNFCKIDPSVTNFVRRVLSIDVGPCEGLLGGGLPAESPQSVWAFTIKGTAFLYHQVRCMVAVLFLVGEGKEDERIISDLLDLERYPRRPNYEMASEAQLLLYDIAYDSIPKFSNGLAAGGIDSGGAATAEASSERRRELSATIDRQLRMTHDLWGEQQRSLMLRGAMLQTMRDALPLEEAAAAAMTAAAAVAGGRAEAAAAVEAEVLAEIAKSRKSYGHMPPGGGLRGRGLQQHIPLAQRPTSESVEVRTKGKAK